MSDLLVGFRLIVVVSDASGETHEVEMAGDKALAVQVGADGQTARKRILDTLAGGLVQGALVLDGPVRAAIAFRGGKVRWHPNMPEQRLAAAAAFPPGAGEWFSAPDALMVGCPKCKSLLSLPNHTTKEPTDERPPEIAPSIVCSACGAHFWARKESRP